MLRRILVCGVAVCLYGCRSRSMEPQENPTINPQLIEELFELTEPNDWLEGPIYRSTSEFSADTLRTLKSLTAVHRENQREHNYFVRLADSRPPALYQILHGRFSRNSIHYSGTEVVDIHIALSVKARDAEAALADFNDLRGSGREWDMDEDRNFAMEPLTGDAADRGFPGSANITTAKFFNSYLHPDFRVFAMKIIRFYEKNLDRNNGVPEYPEYFKEFLYYIPTNSS